MNIKFQSTLPVWGATIMELINDGYIEFQSTLPVWGATLVNKFLIHCLMISIHAPRVGSDPQKTCRYILTERFQSTLPVWGATRERQRSAANRRDFNPRSPCGERLSLAPF